MSYPSETSRVALLLTNRLVEVDAQPFTAREYWSLVDRVDDLAMLLGASAADLAEIVGSVEEAERVRTLLGATTAFAFEQERLEEGGIAVLSSLDDRFPTKLRQRLGPACPPFLLAAGPIDWLDGEALGVVGSRDASEEILGVADAAAAAAVDAEWAVISGLARGVDQAAMKGALDRGGRVIGVPAEGIRRTARNAEVRRHVHAGDLCIVSPYGPDAPFTSGTAMGRNKIVHAISTNTLVVATTEGERRHLGGRQGIARPRLLRALRVGWPGRTAGQRGTGAPRRVSGEGRRRRAPDRGTPALTASHAVLLTAPNGPDNVAGSAPLREGRRVVGARVEAEGGVQGAGGPLDVGGRHDDRDADRRGRDHLDVDPLVGERAEHLRRHAR